MIEYMLVSGNIDWHKHFRKQFENMYNLKICIKRPENIHAN